VAGFHGVLQADGYAGLAVCMSAAKSWRLRAGRTFGAKFHDIHAAGSTLPLAREALERIGKLYAIEERIDGKPPSATPYRDGRH